MESFEMDINCNIKEIDMKSFNFNRLFALSVLTLVVFVGQVSAQSSSPAIKYFQLGTKYAQAQNFEMAAKAFRASVRSDPKFAEAWVMLSASLFELDYWEESEKCMHKAIELKPEIGGNPAVKEMLAIVSGEQPAPNESNGANAKGDEASAADATKYFNLGMAYGKKGDVENATKAFYTAVKIDPDYADAWVGLGVGLYDLGDQQSALKCIRRGVALKPELAENNVVKAVLSEADDSVAVQHQISKN
jgi:Tfp pilus assembly protein PilF